MFESLIPMKKQSPIEVERELGERAAVAGVFQFLVFLVCCLSVPFPNGRPPGTWIAGGSIAAVMLMRFLGYGIQRAFYPSPIWRARWTLLHRLSSLLLGATWGAFTLSALVSNGLVLATFIVLVVNLGIGAIAIQAFGLDLWLVRAFLVLMQAPSILWTLLHFKESGEPGLAGALILYLGYLLILARQAHLMLWEAIRSRELVQAKHDQLTATLDAIPGYVFWTDGSKRSLGSNQKFSALDHQAKSAFDLTSGDFGQVVSEFLKSDREQDLLELSMPWPSGPRAMLIAMRKYSSRSGHLTVIVAFDIEDRKRVERELEQARLNAFESSKLAAVGLMAGGISHEINNPLQTLVYSASLLQTLMRRETLPEKFRESSDRALKQIRETVDRIVRIISGLKNLSRDGRNDPFDPVELKELVEEILELCRTRMAHHGVTIRVRPIPPELVVYCRRTQIGQVLLNLLNNAHDAVEFLDERWIEIEARDLHDRVAIWITDSGAGIPGEIRQKMMLPFFTTKKVGKGTGLGLSISSAIIEDHDGRLYLDPSSRHTRFVIELPKRRAQAALPVVHGKT